jgi:hypothetical protein
LKATCVRTFGGDGADFLGVHGRAHRGNFLEPKRTRGRDEAGVNALAGHIDDLRADGGRDGAADGGNLAVREQQVGLRQHAAADGVDVAALEQDGRGGALGGGDGRGGGGKRHGRKEQQGRRLAAPKEHRHRTGAARLRPYDQTQGKGIRGFHARPPSCAEQVWVLPPL